MDRSDALRQQILELVTQYYEAQFAEKAFVPGETPVQVSGRVFDDADVRSLVDASLDFWLTAGRYAKDFERDLAQFVGVRHAMLVNSGSSANLLALTALTSPTLGERALRPGDEVITVAASFPTTVNPVIQNGLLPVFLDVEMGTYNMDVSRLEEAIGPRSKAIMMAHTLGNPFNLDVVMEVAKRHNLWVIEDDCDALGATYRGRHTGSFGDLATISFYPAHHITTGEGGAVITSTPALKKLVESFRDWGRDCWCEPGVANTCGKRFGWQLGELPHGYDHKYIYSHVGYNMKVTDMQAAVGYSQLKKLPVFIEKRKHNWRYLYEGLKPFEEFLLLPRATEHSDPSWFGFVITVRDEAPFTAREMVAALEGRNIATRKVFAGNLLRQPAFMNIERRIVGSLENTDRVMNQTFWIGVYPGITPAMADYMLETVADFIRAH